MHQIGLSGLVLRKRLDTAEARGCGLMTPDHDEVFTKIERGIGVCRSRSDGLLQALFGIVMLAQLVHQPAQIDQGPKMAALAIGILEAGTGL